MRIVCKLNVLMSKNNINQLQLSEAVGLSPATIGKLYRNQFERIDNATLIKLCKYFDIEIQELFAIENIEITNKTTENNLSGKPPTEKQDAASISRKSS